MKEIYEALKRDKAYTHVLTLLSWDQETEAPKKSIDNIAETVEYFSKMKYENIINPVIKEKVYSINEEELSDLDRKIIKKLKKEYFEKLAKIPVEEEAKFLALVSKSCSVWEEAKVTDNFEILKPYLKDLIVSVKKFINYRGYEGIPYNTLLDDYETGLNTDILDSFFDKVREELVPFILKILKTKNDKIEKAKLKLNRKFDVHKQKEMNLELAGMLGFDFSRGVIKESEHPFTTNMSNKDVRLTTHYYENDVLSAIYSTIHEVGHAIYEQQVLDEYDNTGILGSGSTMGIHEAQSRFYENVIAKNMSFMPIIKGLLKKYFDFDITEEELYLVINEVKRQYIRTEADELTYPVHVMIRYEIEKELFSKLDGDVSVEDIANKWDDLYEKYLGIRPRTRKEGVLQDPHWVYGEFGYFPAYAIGSAYASQMFNALNKEMIAEELIANKEFNKINKFLYERIHKYGSSLEPKDLIKNCCDEEFNPTYYIKYLKDKFSKIYE